MRKFTSFANMATVSFSYRSIKDESFIQLRLLYYPDGSEKRQSLYVPTKVYLSKAFWIDYRKGKNFRDIDRANLKKSVSDELFALQSHVINATEITDPSQFTKQWLKEVVMTYYHPQTPAKSAPESLLGYWDYYMNLRKHELQERIRSWQKWNTVKHKVQRFQQAGGKTFEVKDVNEVFVSDWVEYCQSENYSNATTRKEFSYIKTICVHARTKGVEVSGELDTLRIKLKTNAPPKVYFSFDELDKIKAVKDLPEYLDNARDWLLISCYTGQRVSDFMRFKKSEIRKQQGAMFLDTEQVKTGKMVTVPLLPEVIEILNKRGGQFPRPISAQRYNDWIKEVAKLAGLDEKIKGNVRIDNRNVIGEYPKWKLVASHIGRRSFATNFYGKIPTSFLKNITGHSTEQMLLTYIGKSSNDTAFEAYELMLSALNGKGQ